MRLVVCDETGLVKRVDYGESADTQAVVVKHRVQHRPTAPLVASFDRHPGGGADGVGHDSDHGGAGAGGVAAAAAAHAESTVLLGLADGSIESLDVITGARVAVLPPGTFEAPIVRRAILLLASACLSASSAQVTSLSRARMCSV